MNLVLDEFQININNLPSSDSGHMIMGDSGGGDSGGGDSGGGDAGGGEWWKSIILTLVFFNILKRTLF